MLRRTTKHATVRLTLSYNFHTSNYHHQRRGQQQQQQPEPEFTNNVFGSIPPSNYTLPDFTKRQLDNRVTNASLLRLVESYRKHGHRAALLDPLDLAERPNVPALDPRRYGFPLSDSSSLRPQFVSPTLPTSPALAQLPAGETRVDIDGILDWPEEDDENDQVARGAQGERDGPKWRTIDQVAKRLEEVYCSGIGYEFMHLPSKHERRFLERHLERSHGPSSSSSDGDDLPAEQQLALWRLLARSEGFDFWAAKRFPNVKRYGLEGGEAMMVAVGVLLDLARQADVREVVLAMPHRGRLNLLTQLLDLDMRLVVRKMRGLPTLPPTLPSPTFTDDVLSHLFLTTALPSTSASQDIEDNVKGKGKGKETLVHLLPNPSHLEAVNPVALGFARGLQIPFHHQHASSASPSSVTDQDAADPANLNLNLGTTVLSLQVHGDAAFVGQGVVSESLNLASLPHFNNGGTVRLVVNNQLGYTADAKAGRTSLYATDQGKGIAAPVVHVNGDRVESVVRAVRLAWAYQQKFKKDVLIDLIVYRRRGHNELDNPEYTSPEMYKAIERLPTVPQIYEQQLISRGILSPSTAASERKAHFAQLDQSLEASKLENFTVPEVERLRGWDRMRWPVEGEWRDEVVTGVDENVLRQVGLRSVETPEDVTVHPRLLKMHMAKRVQSVEAGRGLDFSTTEAMAFGSLMLEGYHVRLCGQDSGRGTFSQRHAVVSDQSSARTTVPLQSLTSDPVPISASDEGKKKKTGTFEVVNSPLSEYAVLGFEQGIAWVSPDILPIWEAQFGDFHNTAQTILDTYFASGETKWGLQSALTLLLPHGYDSAGPEHSSARIERFLQLTNEPLSKDEAFIPNTHLVNVTTAAQYFHLLRRQMIREYRKPLVVFSPKGILRLPAASATLEELGPGTSFQPVLVDSPSGAEVERVIFLTGKMYYDLVKERTEKNLDDKVALVRIEEISPFPYDQVSEVVSGIGKNASFTWAQEEPENAGAFTFVAPRIAQVLPKGARLKYVGRRAMATPAPGVGYYFAEQKKGILQEVFEGL
ncbi:2-oxoglutarate dehydrogenase, E1 component [Meredithblackwellia eburnea MCA 4105]